MYILERLQRAMNKLGNFCQVWNLTVNISKTKVIVFNKSGRILKGFAFNFLQTNVEVVQEYKYLGIVFRASGVFSNAVKYLCNKALKAVFCIRKALMSESMNTELYLTIYQHCVKPILLYCSEIWSLDFIVNKNDLTQIEQRYELLQSEKIQVRFLKSVMGVHKYASNNAVRSEFGIFPLAVYGLKSSLSFWTHLVNLDQSTYAYQSYSDSLSYSKGFASKFKLFMSIIGFEHVWINRSTFSKNKLKYAVCNKLKELYIQYWKKSIFDDSGSINGNKLRTFRTFKVKYDKEMYLQINDLPKEYISVH